MRKRGNSSLSLSHPRALSDRVRSFFPSTMQRQQKLLIQQLQNAGLKRILPKADLSSREINGVTSFHPAICKLVLGTNTPRDGAGGDSLGMIKYLKKHLNELASSRPYVEIECIVRSGTFFSLFFNFKANHP